MTDHHAILPTDVLPQLAALSAEELGVYDLVARRTLAALSPPATVATTRLVTSCTGHHFLTKGRQVLSPGWMIYEGQEAPGEDSGKDEDGSIPSGLSESSAPCLSAAARVNGKTTPPAAYNEATLLGAMERSGSDLGDEAMTRAMKGSGLGTPATRADTIETLLKRQYVVREGKSLVATELGTSVVDALSAFPHVTNAELTGRWESMLTRVADGELEASAFMRKVEELTRALVGHFKAHPPRIRAPERETLGACPACRERRVLLSDKGAWCEGFQSKACDFAMRRTGSK